MLFNTLDFLVFFPIVLLVYFVLPTRIRYVWLLVASYYFYMCWNPAYIVLIMLSTVITYVCGRIIDALQENKLKKLVIALSFISNLGILIYFKYTGFLINTLNSLLTAIHFQKIPTFDVLLPVGISFYTFQALGYTVDVYRGEVKAERNLLKYALFVSFFPQLVAGPIERSRNLLNQINDEINHKLWNYERVTSGFITMLWGFFLKVVIADRAAVLVDTVFAGYEQYGMVGLSAGAVAFAIQIYCDFAGYSTIAIGAAKALGFELMDNFDTPYLARGIVDFWNRWHISMSTWFRDYLYIPLGGNRCGKFRHYLNILVTFGVSGLWHGAGWNYISWGVLNGVYQIIEKEIKPIVNRINERFHTRVESFGYKVFQIVVTFFFVDLSMIVFRADSMHQAVHYIQRMFTYRDWWSLFDQSLYTLGLNLQEIHILVFAVILLLMVDILRYKKKKTIAEFLSEQWIVFRWSVLIILLFTCVVFGYYGPGFDSTQFIYFQF